MISILVPWYTRISDIDIYIYDFLLYFLYSCDILFMSVAVYGSSSSPVL